MFDEITSFESLLSAYNRARRGKRFRTASLQFSEHLESNLLGLRKELRGGGYKHGAYYTFIVEDSKRRTIKAASFRDRVVHQAFCGAVEPLFEKIFIADSYACRRKKGVRKAVARFESHARRHRYVLKCDVSKYFASINHERLLAIIGRRIHDPRTMALCRIIVESASDAPMRGIPIGNLTSQLFANIYLNELDHFVKRSLRKRAYVRYMDDFALFADEKHELREAEEKIRNFLSSDLSLTLHPRKVSLEPSLRGVDFLGYRVFRTHRMLRGSTVKRFVKRTKRMMKEIKRGKRSEDSLILSIASWIGYAQKASSRGLSKALARRFGSPTEDIMQRKT